MDVFSAVLAAARPGLLQAALHAAAELGLFSALQGGPRTLADLAAAAGAAPRRLRALLDVIVLEGALSRDAQGRYGLTAAPADGALLAPPREGWGRLAEVLRTGRPLDAEAAFADAAEGLARFHRHLGAAGAAPARALFALLGADHGEDARLLDLGAGIGAYAAAWLAGGPRRRATLVDRAPVLALAAEHLATLVDRAPVLDLAAEHLAEVGAARLAPEHLAASSATPAAAEQRLGAAALLPGDLLDPGLDLGAGFDVALLCNVLHLLSEVDCARLVARAAAALRPGGEVVVKDLLIHPGRSGPAVSVYFALNMALYTDAGDVYDEAQISAWLAAAGLEVRRQELPGVPDALVLRGRRRPESPARAAP